MSKDRQREPRTRPPQPGSEPGSEPGLGLGLARQLLDRISRLARQAREAAEGLAARLLPGPLAGTLGRSEPAPAPAPEPAPALAPELDADNEHVHQPDARVVLLSRDPEWLFCYWDIDPALRTAARSAGSRLTLRLHDVTNIDFDGANGWSQHLYPLTEEARWWHVPVPQRGRHYLAEVGYATPDGAFAAMARSGGVATLSDRVAPLAEVEMATVHIDAPLADQAPAGPGPAADDYGDPPAPGPDAPPPARGSGDAVWSQRR